MAAGAGAVLTGAGVRDVAPVMVSTASSSSSAVLTVADHRIRVASVSGDGDIQRVLGLLEYICVAEQSKVRENSGKYRRILRKFEYWFPDLATSAVQLNQYAWNARDNYNTS